MFKHLNFIGKISKGLKLKCYADKRYYFYQINSQHNQITLLPLMFILLVLIGIRETSNVVDFCPKYSLLDYGGLLW